MNVRTSHLMACPECGSSDQIYIQATICVRLLPYGEIEQNGIEWHDRNHTSCGKCGHLAEAQDFAVDEEGCEP